MRALAIILCPLAACAAAVSLPDTSQVRAAWPCGFKCDDTGACEVTPYLGKVSELKCAYVRDQASVVARCSFEGEWQDAKTGVNFAARHDALYSLENGRWCERQR